MGTHSSRKTLKRNPRFQRFFAELENQNRFHPYIGVMGDTNPKLPASERLSRFLWWCAGTVPETLGMYPTEKAKYEGIGGAVLTTGILAFLSGFYAIYTTIATGPFRILLAIGFGVIWGLAIFNLDRYIVSSLRKPTDSGIPWKRRLAATWLPVIPRLGLAIVIGITVSKPLELRLFHNAIAGQSEINRDRAVAAKRASLTESTRLNELRLELAGINQGIDAAENQARRVEDDFRKEADGTGGSRRYGYSDVARIKEAAAVQARQLATETRSKLEQRQQQVQSEMDKLTAEIERQMTAFRQSLTGDFLTKMTALSELTSSSRSVWWISAFVTFLIIGIEITPVLVKLLSPVGPYDVKLDAMNSVETAETFLKRDTASRIAVHHYELVEKAERQADDEFLDIRTNLASGELDRKAQQWKKARAEETGVTMQHLVGEVRNEILTLRNS
jgi:hypothetical protein